MAFKEAHKEQTALQKERWVSAMTRAWIGMFFFTLLLNVLPFIPGWNSQEAEARFVSQSTHTTTIICISQNWNQGEKPTPVNDDAIVAMSTGAVSGSSQTSKAHCTSSTVISLATASLNPVSWFFADQQIDILSHFFSAYSERGPPAV